MVCQTLKSSACLWRTLTLLVYYSHDPHSLRYDEIETCVTMLSITIGSLHNKLKSLARSMQRYHNKPITPFLK